MMRRERIVNLHFNHREDFSEEEAPMGRLDEHELAR